MSFSPISQSSSALHEVDSKATSILKPATHLFLSLWLTYFRIRVLLQKNKSKEMIVAKPLVLGVTKHQMNWQLAHIVTWASSFSSRAQCLRSFSFWDAHTLHIYEFVEKYNGSQGVLYTALGRPTLPTRTPMGAPTLHAKFRLSAEKGRARGRFQLWLPDY